MALNAKAAQEFVPIREVRDGIIVLKDDELRAIVLANSTNLSLKSEDEQNALVQAYINFINSFDFPIQIVIQSRKLNIDEYINRLRDMYNKQTNELLRIQTVDYIQYIQEYP